MKPFKKGISIIIITFLSISCFGQNKNIITQLPCGFDEIHQSLLKNNPDYLQSVKSIDKRIQLFIKDSLSGKHNNKGKFQQKAAVVYTIPVVVHVIHLGESVGVGTNISNAQIYGAISGLNDRFRSLIGNGTDVELQFCLASRDPNGNATTGINRVNGSGVANYASQGMGIQNFCPGSASETAIKGLSTWPNNSYYNIWVVKSICNGNWGGYAYFPGNPANIDGAAVIYNFFNYDNATTAHELGHGFNLYHTFQGDNNNANCPANSNCSADGDQCCDTPPHKQNDCGPTNPCTTSGIWDNSRYNYMSYCYLGWPPPSTNYGRFTPNQISRMRATLTVSPRAALLNSQGCNAVSPPLCNNDNSCSPMTLSVNTSGNCVTTNCSTINATPQSPSIPFSSGSGCNFSYPVSSYDDDVWFSITTTGSNTLTIRVTPTSNTSNFDPVIGLYQGGCANPSQVNCADLFGVGVTENLIFTTPAGTNTYLIRVFSYGSGSAFSGNFDICTFINCTLPGAVTVNGGGTFCNSAILTASGGSGGTIYWQGNTNNGTSTAVASASQTVTASGTYYFRAFNSCGWGTQGSATVTIINSAPNAVTVNGGGAFCNNATLTASGGSGGTIYWQGNISGGTSTANSTNPQIVTSSGTYYFRANNICGWGAEGSATVTINSIPGAVTVNGSGTFCNSAILTASGGSDGTIYWQGTTNNGTSTAVASASQTVTASGTYYFRAFNSCGWGTQGSATVTMINTPPVLQAGISSFIRSTTQITANLSPGNGTRRIVKINTLENFTAPINGTDPVADSIYSGVGEQVVMNGNRISITINNLTPGTNYCFRVYEANCTGSASVYNINGTNNLCEKTLSNISLPDINGIEEFTIFPNPNKGDFNVRMKFISGRNVQFKLINMLGQVVYLSATYQIVGLQTKGISVQKIASGIYLLETIVGSESFRRSIIILNR